MFLDTMGGSEYNLLGFLMESFAIFFQQFRTSYRIIYENKIWTFYRGVVRRFNRNKKNKNKFILKEIKVDLIVEIWGLKY
jgi:hypothetical protein